MSLVVSLLLKSGQPEQPHGETPGINTTKLGQLGDSTLLSMTPAGESHMLTHPLFSINFTHLESFFFHRICDSVSSQSYAMGIQRLSISIELRIDVRYPAPKTCATFWNQEIMGQHHGAILLFIFSLFMNETYVGFGWDIEIRTNSIILLGYRGSPKPWVSLLKLSNVG